MSSLDQSADSDEGRYEPSAPVGDFRFSDQPIARLTHYLFRFPAKFHPPVARKLIESYSRVGQRVMDPFCGSGTLLVEALAQQRDAVGSDVDPLAVFISSVKCHRIRPSHFRAASERVVEAVSTFRRPESEYQDRMFSSLSMEEYEAELSGLWVPAIPNLHHWFRRYVTVDLARISATIRTVPMQGTVRRALLLVFASIIRNCSNADPVPVSGLEVTSHMRRLDAAGRLINPFELFQKAIRKAQKAFSDLYALRSDGQVRVIRANAMELSGKLRIRPDVLITSPPYHNAVDYYRRHQLEMYWLALTESHRSRLALLQEYIGRPKVAARHHLVSSHDLRTPLARDWHAKISAVDSNRANSFKHYIVGLAKCMAEFGRLLDEGKRAIFVVGDSSWRGHQLPTVNLLREACEHDFEIEDVMTYPLRNRYMSYSRKNNASIAHESVVVLRRLGA